MTLAKRLLSTTGQQDKLYVEDVFSAYTYTGNSTTQTITNGIDLAGKGGLVWLKGRSNTTSNVLTDTVRGPGNAVISETTQANVSSLNIISGFTSSGFSVGSDNSANASGWTYASWTFRKAVKFFDVVTYTGDGTSNRQIAHAIGIAPGLITTKATSTTSDWNTYHISATGDLVLNTTAAQTGSKASVNGASATTFTVSGVANNLGTSYVAYLWAHDPSVDGIVQCGSYVGNGSVTGPVINLGWEPQYLLVKNVSGTGFWTAIDSIRGMPVGSVDAAIQANTTAAEFSYDFVSPTAAGFQVVTTGGDANTSGNTYIYMAIRRPMKTPTTGAQVYNAIARAGTGGAATVSGVGFAPDLAIGSTRNALRNHVPVDRLRGAKLGISTTANAAETADAAGLTEFTMDGCNLGVDNSYSGTFNVSGETKIIHFFRRASGFMDVVCDTGTGAAHTIAHNLTVTPEIIIRKGRSGATQWEVLHSALAATEKLVLNSTAAKVTDATAWNSAAPSSTSFSVGTGANVNTNTATYVSYLFATMPGVSKVGSYTGNGTTQVINCNFGTGARFVMIKRTDSTGDWFVWDTVRGIIAANDPYLSLNTTAAEVTTDDSIDPDTSGFIVNQVAATNINVNAATYIFLAIA